MSVLSKARVEVIASRAGGMCVGAPTTREEERLMAQEILVLRDLAKAIDGALDDDHDGRLGQVHEAVEAYERLTGGGS